jgi:hypothetical protein
VRYPLLPEIPISTDNHRLVPANDEPLDRLQYPVGSCIIVISEYKPHYWVERIQTNSPHLREFFNLWWVPAECIKLVDRDRPTDE